MKVVNPPGASQLSSLTSLKDLYDEWRDKAKIAVVREDLSPLCDLTSRRPESWKVQPWKSLHPSPFLREGHAVPRGIGRRREAQTW